MNILKKLKLIGMKVLKKKYSMLLMGTLILIFGTYNVNAYSNTSYTSFERYLYWYNSDKQAVNELNQTDNQILYNKYLNIPLRVANYCNNMPGSDNGNCPSTYQSSFIGMHGLNNGSVTQANPYAYYGGSVNFVTLETKNGNGNTWSYYSTNNTMKKGWFTTAYSEYEQTHTQNEAYYVNGTRGDYIYRKVIRSDFAFNNGYVPLTTSNNYSPAFSQGNVLMYKLSYMLGPSVGSFGDGTYATIGHPDYDPDAYGDYTGSIKDYAFDAVRKNVTMWFNESDKYDDYLYNNRYLRNQNNKFASMFDALAWPAGGINYPGCRGNEACMNTPMFQETYPMMRFLDMYGHTYYDKTTNLVYNKRTSCNGNLNSNDCTISWESSNGTYGQLVLQDGNTDIASLSTSTVIVAQPYNWVYDDGVNDKQYSTVWFLDIYFFGYIDNNYNFDHIRADFHMDNQLSVYGNVSQLDLMIPDTKVMVIGSVDSIQEINAALEDDLIDLIRAFPVIGGILALLINTLLFVFSFVYNIFVLFSSLPLWIRGGLLLLFLSIVIKIIRNFIRGD